MPNDVEGVEPIYKEFKGWNCELPSNSFNDLPQEIKTYIEFIEKETGVPVSIISTGPEREKTIIR
jgi:adenylosuccinate synthase